MRKPLSRDKNLISTRLPIGVKDGRNVTVQPEDVQF